MEIHNPNPSLDHYLVEFCNSNFVGVLPPVYDSLKSHLNIPTMFAPLSLDTKAHAYIKSFFDWLNNDHPTLPEMGVYLNGYRHKFKWSLEDCVLFFEVDFNVVYINQELKVTRTSFNVQTVKVV